ncbi:hypothetical protein C7M84_021327 [Penaeus vannamei]|uniref:Uncharacterized protein n=1 Tax=Penaeus vannamei TaxID=6689 RepID=A0A3R7MKD2_PENVA|nr:hypothetical protein C7M84_021327 [Penaeus vannamei]
MAFSRPPHPNTTIYPYPKLLPTPYPCPRPHIPAVCSPYPSSPPSHQVIGPIVLPISIYYGRLVLYTTRRFYYTCPFSFTPCELILLSSGLSFLRDTDYSSSLHCAIDALRICPHVHLNYHISLLLSPTTTTHNIPLSLHRQRPYHSFPLPCPRTQYPLSPATVRPHSSHSPPHRTNTNIPLSLLPTPLRPPHHFPFSPLFPSPRPRTHNIPLSLPPRVPTISLSPSSPTYTQISLPSLPSHVPTISLSLLPSQRLSRTHNIPLSLPPRMSPPFPLSSSPPRTHTISLSPCHRTYPPFPSLPSSPTRYTTIPFSPANAQYPPFPSLPPRPTYTQYPSSPCQHAPSPHFLSLPPSPTRTHNIPLLPAPRVRQNPPFPLSPPQPTYTHISPLPAIAYVHSHHFPLSLPAHVHTISPSPCHRAAFPSLLSFPTYTQYPPSPCQRAYPPFPSLPPRPRTHNIPLSLPSRVPTISLSPSLLHVVHTYPLSLPSRRNPPFPVSPLPVPRTCMCPILYLNVLCMTSLSPWRICMPPSFPIATFEAALVRCINHYSRFINEQSSLIALPAPPHRHAASVMLPRPDTL